MDAEEILKQRRERGRLAQAAFRQRQQKTVQSLEQQIDTLKASIEAIGEASQAVHNPNLRHAINMALGLAGLEELRKKTTAVKGGSEDITGVAETPGSAASERGVLAPAGSANQAPGEKERGKQAAPPRQPIPEQSAQARQTSATLEVQGDSTEQPTDHGEGGDKSPLRGPPTEPRYGGRMSPRLTYGLWYEPESEPEPRRELELERPMYTSDPPRDVAPYLGDAATSFAGAIYWGTLATAFTMLRDGELLATAQRGEGGRDILGDTFGMSFRLDSAPAVAARIHARLTFRVAGQVEREHPGRDADAAFRLHALTTREVVRRGDNMANYLSARDVVEAIRRWCGDAVVNQLECVARGEGDRRGYASLAQLVHLFALRSICFGDGPRYPVAAVFEVITGQLVGHWTQQAMS